MKSKDGINQLDRNCLVSLTGDFSFNAEPPTDVLLEQGFITSAQLTYVRNHGNVPILEWAEHHLDLYKDKNLRKSYSMDDLFSSYKIYNFQITFACNGNRRKELNMTKNTGEFNWGPGAVSNSHYSGIKLCDVISNLFGDITTENAHELHVHFEGADKLSHGCYGTSIPYLDAINPYNDIILAYKQNKELLKHDHGYPIRLIIPGYVGGRNIKWLKTIRITNHESDNWYHLHDNRKMPSHVESFEQAETEKWWYNPDTILTEQILQSVISHPRHNTLININRNKIIKIQGFAYNGGGRRIAKIEVSLDEGASWILCNKINSEPTEAFESNNYNTKVWTWYFWNTSITSDMLYDKKQIMVRAWDSTLNTQPVQQSWSLKGFMNNSIYTIKLIKKGSSILFQHPVKCGPDIYDGWMELEMKKKLAQEAVLSLDFENDKSDMYKNTADDECLVIINNKVYNLTDSLATHPGGSSILKKYSGKDATKIFNRIHSSVTLKKAEHLVVGEVTSLSVFK